ncbi:hypothetical protein CR513_54024, partial [Mucuna pruriens]
LSLILGKRGYFILNFEKLTVKGKPACGCWLITYKISKILLLSVKGKSTLVVWAGQFWGMTPCNLTKSMKQHKEIESVIYFLKVTQQERKSYSPNIGNTIALAATIDNKNSRQSVNSFGPPGYRSRNSNTIVNVATTTNQKPTIAQAPQSNPSVQLSPGDNKHLLSLLQHSKLDASTSNNLVSNNLPKDASITYMISHTIQSGNILDIGSTNHISLCQMQQTVVCDSCHMLNSQDSLSLLALQNL